MRPKPLPKVADILERMRIFLPTGEPRPEILRGHPRAYMGVDLGQAQDHAAIVVLQRLELNLPERDPITWQYPHATLIVARHAERIPLGLSYPAIADYVATLAQQAPMTDRGQIVVDATGLGAPVVDLLREKSAIRSQVVPVVITSGEFATDANGRWYVPKRDLIDGVRIAFEGGRIAISQEIDHLSSLTEELENMRYRRNPQTGAGRISGRKHDDLVLALSLAWWRASRDAGRTS
jgi:hypothetical protein